MVDETTGGKPLMGRITFGPGDNENDASRRLAAEAEFSAAINHKPTHTAIPTAALTELLAAAEECAGDLADEASIKYPHADTNRTEERLYERDMAPVRRVRAAVARVRGE